jgi:dTDP-4-dehydro-6-deoxy-alpha-D-glucopyranose 2,3-dehydratase
VIDTLLTYSEPAAAENIGTARRLMTSAATLDSPLMPNDRLHSWLASRLAANNFQVTRIPFTDLSGWDFQDDSGNLRHSSGRFFSIEGVRVRTDRRWISNWTQPIIIQPEIGILGILVKEFNGVLHALMQAKMEPGNVNSLQLSPTVQATRSNYTAVHRGSSIKYLEYFATDRNRRVLVDVLQSEQGAWFLHKRNRNMVVEALDDVPSGGDFCWLTLGQIRRLLQFSNLINMDSRTVVSCMPTALSGDPATDPEVDPGTFAGSVLHSLSDRTSSLHTAGDVLSWLTDQRARRELVQQRVPLNYTMEGGWYRNAFEVAHESGVYFKVIAVDVRASNREVGHWTQPLVAPNQGGLLAFLTKRIGGVLHVLMQARIDAGTLNGAELAPTVHCQPGNYRDVQPEFRPPYLDHVLSADPASIRYDVVQSEEGGRFYQAQNRNVVIEVADDFPLEAPENFRWMTLNQLRALLLHSNYLNIEARSLVACMQSLW